MRVTAVNCGARPAPYGLGGHPYLTLDRPVDGCVLQVPGELRQPVDARELPQGPPVPVTGTPYDFRAARPVGDLRLNHAYIGLSGPVVLGDGERRLTVWQDAAMPWVQLCTADHLGRPALAVEPMSCPPNALASGVDLVVLGPGGSHQARWGIGAGPAA